MVWWMIGSFENSAGPVYNRSLFLKWSEQEVGGGSLDEGGGRWGVSHPSQWLYCPVKRKQAIITARTLLDSSCFFFHF